MEQRSKTHHFLPQFVLRGFAKAGCVTTRDLVDDRTYVQTIQTTAAENNDSTVELDHGSLTDAAELTDAAAELTDAAARRRVRGQVIAKRWSASV